MSESLRVLIVEDSEDDTELLLLELRKGKFRPNNYRRVDTAEAMEQALDEETWDLVIADHRMPQFNALSALEILKQRNIDLPFIIVSGFIGEETAVEAMRAGAHDYLLKNNLTRLIPAIRRELREVESRRKRRLAEKDLQQYHDRLQVLHDIDKDILAARSKEEISATVAKHLCELIECEWACILAVTENHDAEVLAVMDSVDSGITPGIVFTQDEWDLAGLAGDSDIRIVDDIHQAPLASRTVHTLHSAGLRSLIIAPLIVDTILIGAIYMGRISSEAVSADDIDISREIANIFAVAMQQHKLHEQIRNHADELKKRVEERTKELRAINTELEAFTYSVSHDLRAPLRAVLGYGEALYEEYGERLGQSGQEYIRKMIESTMHMDSLIQDLLLYSHLSHPESSLWPVNLTSVLSEAIAQLNTDIRARNAAITIEEPLPRIMGNREILVQIIINLLSNAIKFTPPDRRPSVEVRTESDSDCIRLTVEDNGIGIPAEYHEQVFHIFERLHTLEEYPGNGIGLAIVRKGMERMNGTVEILQPQDGTGTCFRLQWPRKGGRAS